MSLIIQGETYFHVPVKIREHEELVEVVYNGDTKDRMIKIKYPERWMNFGDLKIFNEELQKSIGELEKHLDSL